ncbi:iron-siderophore ABC transporter substrate-binding protein, partial [Xanthomonas citri pv. citri]|nr:iron-siderophore ABC transporter substrate-binding protein [Xanthomonas citri pv. citri]
MSLPTSLYQGGRSHMMHYTHSRRAFIQGSVGALALSALAACS